MGKGVLMRKRRKGASRNMTDLIPLPRLSAAASAFIHQHPDQARLAISAALEAAASQSESGAHPRAASAVRPSLRPFVVEAPPPLSRDFITAEAAAKRLRISRATVYNWIDSRRLIAWRLTRQGTLIPAEQILGPHELVAGIEQVLAVIPESRAAWRFLTEKASFFDRPRRPIDVLKAGKVEDVLAAARVSGETFT